MRRAISLIVAVLVIVAFASPVLLVRADEPVVVVMSLGDTRDDFYLTINNTGQVTFNAAARANGTAAAWVTPAAVDFGPLAPGQSKTIDRAFTLTVPTNATLGDYTLDWTFYAYNNTAYQDLFVRGYVIRLVLTTSSTSMETQFTTSLDKASFNFEKIPGLLI